MEQTLLLNATYEPLRVVHWQKAITLWCQGKVEIVAVYDREVRSVSFSFKLPSVIRLLRRIRMRRRVEYVPFSRANIYARDNHRCQYCGDHFPTSDLTFDHVVPVAQGGRKDWENIVTCCITCNRKKGGRTPEQARMHLIRHPRRPDRAPAIRITFGIRNAPESWRDYVYWNVELEEGPPFPRRGRGRARGWRSPDRTCRCRRTVRRTSWSPRPTRASSPRRGRPFA